jgi:ABC-type nickel/cobalt efflux system permease component RcnA
MIGLGTLGIVLLQGSAAVSVVASFRRHADRHWWRTILAPLLGAAGLLTAVVLLSLNYSLLTGTSLASVNYMPWLFVVAAAVGIGYARWMRTAQPARYRNLAPIQSRPDQDDETTCPADVQPMIAVRRG